VEGVPFCVAHEAQRQTYLTRHAVDPENDPALLVRALYEGLVAEEPPVPWQDAARALARADGIPVAIRRRAAVQYYQLARTRALDVDWPNAPLWRFIHYWTWLLGGEQGLPPANHPPAPPAAGLAGLARDAQNVHTRVVTDQTNAATTKLLSIKVPESQQTERTLALVWLGPLTVPYSSFLRVSTDINRWFNTKDCRIVDDNLYRKLLRGLVALIASGEDAERKTELYRRLWEECCESVNMCCEGHISRLCNVMVGFDDAFQPPVPFGEILQSKMSVIASLDVSEEEKRRQANAFFDEHKTPADVRAAWLEAF
jgi:hypothetical protein